MDTQIIYRTGKQATWTGTEQWIVSNVAGLVTFDTVQISHGDVIGSSRRTMPIAEFKALIVGWTRVEERTF